MSARTLGHAAAIALTSHVLADVAAERLAQDDKHGDQDAVPYGTGGAGHAALAYASRLACDSAFSVGLGTWRHILVEEVDEAIAEADPVRLRAELVQVAAVAVAWVEATDRSRAPWDPAGTWAQS